MNDKLEKEFKELIEKYKQIKNQLSEKIETVEEDDYDLFPDSLKEELNIILDLSDIDRPSHWYSSSC